MTQPTFHRPHKRRPPNIVGLYGLALPSLFVAALFSTSTSFAAKAGLALPNAVQATYKVYRSGILLGNVEERFDRDGDRYKITSTTRTEGPISLLIREQLSATSEGRISSAGLVPDVFTSTRKSDSTKSFTSRFNWGKNELVREHENADVEGGIEKEVFTLPSGTQDRLSAMYQFMVTTPSTTSVSALMTQGKQTERYQYRKQGEPTLSTRAGQFATVHYVREAVPGESTAEVWLAKEHNYIPVRVVFRDAKGTSLEQNLVELSVR